MRRILRVIPQTDAILHTFINHVLSFWPLERTRSNSVFLLWESRWPTRQIWGKAVFLSQHLRTRSSGELPRAQTDGVGRAEERERLFFLLLSFKINISAFIGRRGSSYSLSKVQTKSPCNSSGGANQDHQKHAVFFRGVLAEAALELSFASNWQRNSLDYFAECRPLLRRSQWSQKLFCLTSLYSFNH